jgi:hypothetical protein
MRNTALILATCSFLFLVPAAGAQGTQGPNGQTQTPGLDVSKMSSRSFRRLEVPGAQVEKNVKRLTKEMTWYSTLSGALAAGRAKNKPVLWIHALGDLDGFL